MTRWCVSPDRIWDTPGRSRRSLTITAGHTSCCCPTMTTRTSVGMLRSLLKRSSPITKTTRSCGSESVLIHQTNSSTIFYSKYDHVHEVYCIHLTGVVLCFPYLGCNVCCTGSDKVDKYEKEVGNNFSLQVFC